MNMALSSSTADTLRPSCCSIACIVRKFRQSARKQRSNSETYQHGCNSCQAAEL